MLMKHIHIGFDRICGTPVPERGEYVSDAVWLELPECPVCYEDREYQLPQGLIRDSCGVNILFLEEVPTLAQHEPKLNKREEEPTVRNQPLYLRQYLE